MEKAFYNETLKKVMQDITKEKTKENLGKLAAAIYSTNLLIPAIWDKEPTIEKDGKVKFASNTHFQFAVLKNENQQSFLVMFTNYDEFRKWDPEERFQPLVLPFRQFMNLIEALLKDLTGILLDPLSEQVTVGMDFLKGIKVGQNVKLEKREFDEGQSIQLKDPEDGHAFVQVIKESAPTVEEVQSIYLKERDGHWFIIVDTKNETTEVFQKLGRMWSKHAMGKQMEFMFASAPVCEDIIKFSRPVYKK